MKSKKSLKKKNQEFSKKIDCVHSDIDQDQLQNKDEYSQHKNNIGLIKQKLYVKLLPQSVLIKQRPSKV